MKSQAAINPTTLKNARKAAGLSLAELAGKVHVAGGEQRVRAWESGADKPTFEQARALAVQVHLPFAALFLPPDTIGEAPPPDLRTRSARRPMSPDLLEVYRDALRKQAWVRETRIAEEHAPLAFVGAGKQRESVEDAAGDIRAMLGLDANLRAEAQDASKLLGLLADRAEAQGIIVLRSSIVGNSTRRKLDVDEFRGFAIADAHAPLVFVNTADASVAQVFTLVHELTHLWRAETGISQPSLMTRRRERDVEAFCDAVAAEVLVPVVELEAAWSSARELAENAEHLRRVFKVSAVVVARRAFDAGLVSQKAYTAFAREQYRLAAARAARATAGGPQFLVVVPIRNSRTVTNMVVRAVRSGKLLYRDASRLLGVAPQHIDELACLQRGAGDHEVSTLRMSAQT